MVFSYMKGSGFALVSRPRRDAIGFDVGSFEQSPVRKKNVNGSWGGTKGLIRDALDPANQPAQIRVSNRRSRLICHGGMA